MAKYFGKIGYSITSETSPGIWESSIIEKNYYGDTLKVSAQISQNDNVNGNVTVNTQISIMADAFANQNFSNMRYIEYMGVLWKTSSISVERPRLVITLGGLYDGETA